MAMTKKELDALKSRIITADQYRDLDPEEKEKYIPYNPGVGDAALEQLIRIINSQMMIPILMQPVFEIMSRLPNPNPAQTLANIAQPINEIVKTLDAIKSLEDVPVIGQIAKPLVDLVNSLLEVIGGFVSLFFLIGKGVPLFTDNLVDSYHIIEQYMKTNPENSESILTAYAEVDWEELATNNPIMDEFIKIIRPQIIQPLDTITKTIDTIGVAVTALEASGTTYEGQLNTWSKLFKFLGVKTDALHIPTDDEVKQKLSNPLGVMKSWNESLENLCSTRYITKDDNQKLLKLREEQEAKKKAEEEAKKKAKEEAKKKAEEAKKKGSTNG